jgi:hypothetical protein
MATPAADRDVPDRVDVIAWDVTAWDVIAWDVIAWDVTAWDVVAAAGDAATVAALLRAPQPPGRPGRPGRPWRSRTAEKQRDVKLSDVS